MSPPLPPMDHMDQAVDEQAAGALALLAVHVYLDHPGLTLQDARVQISQRIDGLRKRGAAVVFLGSGLGPEAMRPSAADHKRARVFVHGAPLPVRAASVEALGSTARELRKRGMLGVLLLNAYRLTRGMWRPQSPGDWLLDNPPRRGSA